MSIDRTLRQVLANPQLLRLQLAWLIGIAAEKAFLVALLVYAWDLGGVVAVGVFTMLVSLPSGLFGPVLSSVAESFPPSRVLLGLHLVRGAMAMVIAVAIAGDLGVWIVVAATIVEGILTRQHTAFTRALLPALARTPDELIAANGVTSLGEAIGALVGPALIGVVLVLAGTVVAIAAPSLAYLAAAVLVLTLSVGAVAPSRVAGIAARLREILGGFAALGRHRAAGLLVAMFMTQVVVRGILTVLLVSAAFALLGMGDGGVGVLNAAIGAGGLVGAVLALTLVMGRSLAGSFAVSLAVWGAPIAVIGLVASPVVAIAMAGIIGAANASIDVAGYTLLARCVPNEARGRVFGVLQSLVGIGVALGALLAPVMVGAFGLPAALVVTGTVLPIAALVGYPSVRRAEAAAILPERELAAMRPVPMFAPLPLTTLEELARSLVPVTFEVGDRIVTQGEPGDCYYIVESGEVAIIHDGHRETTLGPGEGFGEIALLRDRPRTATVEVVERFSGYRLPREAFLAGVTGSPSSVTAADELMDRRLAELEH